MTTLKNYYITVKAHEIHEVTYRVEAESKEHAEQFKAVLAKAELRFKALTGVEKRHAEAYQVKLGEIA